MSEIYLGIDLGGTNVKLGCFDSDMSVVRKTAVPTQADTGPEALVERIGETSDKLLKDAGFSMDDVPMVGMGCPGPAKYRQGIIESATNLPKFRNVPIRDMLEGKLGKPAVFENDANVAAWGEFAAGAGKDVWDMVFFTLGTGIGGGIINQGKLLKGAGDNSAELGHLIVYPGGRRCNCGQFGCAEAYASASATARRAQEAVEQGAESSLKFVLDEKGEITARDVYEHLAKGDKLAKEITDETAKVLAILCVNMLHVTEPKRIVFAGGMIAAGDILLNRIRECFDEQIWQLKKEPVEICFATLGEDAGIIGAAALARDSYHQAKK